MKTIHFKTAEAFRTWLEKNHDKETELGVAFYKKDSGKSGITYKEAVKEALCFGWIDGVGRRIDEQSHMNRFTPRKQKSTWSNVNVGYVNELIKEEKMMPAGLAAYERRSKERTGIYAFENKDKAALSHAFEKEFRSNKKAWQFFESCPAWYKKTAIWLVISAKKEETKLKRLKQLIEDSSQGKTIKQLTRNT